MIRLLLCLTAQGITVDSQTNALSLYNILEGVAAESFPVFLQNISYLCLLQKDADDQSTYAATFRVLIDTDELLHQDVQLDFASRLRNRVIIRVPGLVVPRPGNLVFQLTLPDQINSEYTVAASLAQPQPSQVVPPQPNA